MQDKCHAIAVKKGWWDDNREFPTLMMLVVTELSEAVQEDRKHEYPDIDLKVETEVADAFIRLFDMCGRWFPTIEDTIIAKMKINEKRPYKHNRRY